MSSLDRKFCSGCQSFKPLEGGEEKKTRNFSRWVCKPCANRMSVSPYKRKTANVVQNL